MNGFQILFLSLVALMVAAQWWLAGRQIEHVRANRGAVPKAFRRRIPLKAHRRAADYTVARTRFARIENVVGAGLLLAWTVGGGLDVLDRWLRAFDMGPVPTGMTFILGALFIMGILELPGEGYQTFVIESRFGFNRVTPALFAIDYLRKTLLLFLLGTPLSAVAVWLMLRTGALWWVYVWLLWTGFSLFMIWAYPTLIAPLFNRFQPMKDGALRRRLRDLLRRCGFTSRGVYVIDSSRRTAHGNAYFTGLGRAKRIVFFDNLLKSLRAPEIEAVLAHELGHFKRHHVAQRMLLMFTLSLAALGLLGWLMRQEWFFTGLGIAQPSPYAALMLFLLAGPVFTFFLHPLFAMASRRHEYQADEFAAEQTDARHLVRALVKLYRENANTLTPDPMHSAFYDSHPPALARIERLMLFK
jgi:STE24 endopeptidase